MLIVAKKVREKSKECHNYKSQPFPDPKRKRKPTNLNKYKPNKRTKSTKISSLFPKRGNRNTKRTEQHKNKMTHGKTYNKSPRRINTVFILNIRIPKILTIHILKNTSMVLTVDVSKTDGWMANIVTLIRRLVLRLLISVYTLLRTVCLNT